MELIIVKPENCVGCNSCVRTCPAPEANITKQLDDGRFVTTVNYDKCIACGECVRNCSHGARDYIDDTKRAMEIVNTKGSNIIVIAAPAIKTVFPDRWKSILNWFKKQGCKVYDVSFGADICTWAHLRAIQNRQVGNVITQPCAAIVRYSEIYQPKLLNNLSPIHSPMLCAVTYIRKYLHRPEKILALSPCIAKKNEFLETGLVDFNVTYKKLMEYFEQNGIRLPADTTGNFSYNFDGEQGQLGGIYPRIGGLRDNLWLHDPDIHITTSEGVHKVYPELDMYAGLPENKKPEVFDVLSCEFGCNVGAGTGTDKTVFDVMETMRSVEREAKSRRKVSGGFFRGAEDKLFKRFDEELNVIDFMRNYKVQEPTPAPPEAALNAVFEMMGKHTEAERNFNCHACGYRSCKDMATAIYRGLNTANNCIVHAKSVLVARHSELAAHHEQLAEIAERCKELSGMLDSNVTGILGNMEEINKSTDTSDDLSSKVHGLLDDVISYCSNFSTLDENGVLQLIEILRTTSKAFEGLDVNIKSVNNSTASVNEKIEEIKTLVADINNTLDTVN